MAELVVPTVEDAERIAAVDQRASQALHGASEESAAGRGALVRAARSSIPAADMRLAVDAGRRRGRLRRRQRARGRHARGLVDLRARPARRGAGAALRLGAAAGSERAGVGWQDPVLRRRATTAHFAASLGDRRYARHPLVLRDGTMRSRASSSCRSGRRASPSGHSRSATREAVYAAHDEAFADHWGYTPMSVRGVGLQNLARRTRT